MKKKMNRKEAIRSLGLLSLIPVVPNTTNTKPNTPQYEEAENGKGFFAYQNPISIGIDIHGLRDCQIIRDGEWWYLTGTASPFGLKKEKNSAHSRGVPLYKSKNLVEWQFIKYIVTPDGSKKWYFKNFWAPEIHKISGKYYVTFNCRNEEMGYDWQHFGYAVSDRIEGPYEVVTEDKPLARGNDVTLFKDDDDRVYAFWHNVLEDGTFWMGGAEIDLEKGSFISETFQTIKTGKVDYERDSDGSIKTIFRYGRHEKKIKTYYQWDSQGIEGAFVIKRENLYYLFYSSWTRGYEIGYATSKNIRGPWKKGKNNPIYGGVDEKLCERKGFNCKKDPLDPFNAVGHNAVFKGPDGNLWLSCHGTSKYLNTPFLVIDPIEFDAMGGIKRMAPTYLPQIIQNVNVSIK